MTTDRQLETDRSQALVPIAQLSESYRFDAELARLLTQFQYRADGLELTAAAPRPLPQAAVEYPTPGLEAVFTAGSSLVFVCYDDRRHRMVNPIETALVSACAEILAPTPSPRADGGPLGERAVDTPAAAAPAAPPQPSARDLATSLSVGVVTPHNAQRGALETALPDAITANTVEKYQGRERDVMAVSATVSDPEFARQEERFILNPRRLLVAISRARLLTIVVCSRALFEVIPDESDRLDSGPIWTRLFTQAVGRDADPAWAGPLGEFVGDDSGEHADVGVWVYPSTLDVDGGGE
jgi:hypothetical protein